MHAVNSAMNRVNCAVHAVNCAMYPGEKKKEPATPGKAKGKMSTKEVPLIEVDKASESGDHGNNTSENSKGMSLFSHR